MLSKNDIEQIKNEAFAQAIEELKQEFSTDLDKLKQLNEIYKKNEVKKDDRTGQNAIS